MRLIDGDKVEERLMLLQTNCERKPNQLTSAIWGALEAVREFVREQPSIEPVKRGKWLRMERCNMDGDITYSANCSVCSAEVCLWQHESYCPCCGAIMDGDNK